jgi:hypothetical protein
MIFRASPKADKMNSIATNDPKAVRSYKENEKVYYRDVTSTAYKAL